MQIINSNQKTILLFWYTDCHTTTYQTLNLASRLQSNGLNTVLISLEYRFNNMDYNLFHASYLYQSYIMPSYYGKYIMVKSINYIKELDPDYYNLYQDDVMDMHCLVLDTHGKVVKRIPLIQMKELGDDILLSILKNT